MRGHATAVGYNPFRRLISNFECSICKCHNVPMKTPKSMARHHHWVPQFYLIGFSFERKPGLRQLVAHDLDEGRSFLTNPRNVGGSRDFNRINLEGHSPDAIETSLSGFESEVAIAIDNIVKAREFDPDSLNWIFNLIALLAVRNPRMRGIRETFETSVWDKVMDVLVSSPDLFNRQIYSAQDAGFIAQDADIDFEAISEFVKKRNYVWEVPTERHLISEFDALDTVLKLLGRRFWTLVECDDRLGGFVTSDHPVELQPSASSLRTQRIGFGSPNSTVTFPMTSTFCLIGNFVEAPVYWKASQDNVAILNTGTVQNAEHYVYSKNLGFQIWDFGKSKSFQFDRPN